MRHVGRGNEPEAIKSRLKTLVRLQDGVDCAERSATRQRNGQPRMRIHDGSRRRRAVDTKSQLVEDFMSRTPSVLNGKVLIAGHVKVWESRDISSGRCPEIGDQRRTVIND